MSICKGTVSILDAGCEVYTRIWCIFELYKSVIGRDMNHEFDVYTEIDERSTKAVGITHGLVPMDEGIVYTKKYREAKFPLERILQASDVDVKNVQASVESDRGTIRSEDDEVLDNHANYDELNNI